MRLLLERINVQIGLLLVVCVSLFHGAVLLILLLVGPGRAPPNSQLDTTAAAIAMLDAAEPEQRERLLMAFDRVGTGVRLRSAPQDAAIITGGSDLTVGYLRSRLPKSVSLASGDASSNRTMHVRLADKAALTVILGPPDRDPVMIILVTMGFVAVSLLVFSIWAAMSLTRPLTNFAEAVEAFSLDTDPTPLLEQGSREVRGAARAFNRMQVRITSMAAAQARTLAAISHDLRTPITRMRLRAEFIADEDSRRLTLRDLEQMDGMVHACLSYLRGNARRSFELVDVASLVQTVADTFVETGADVSVTETSRFVVNGNPDDLMRAVTNLTDNAVKFTGSAELSVGKDDTGIMLEIADRGPGIAPAARARMLEPFERGDASRGRQDADGYGLGLAITRAIAEAHGGSLVFADRVGGGMIARIVVPAPLRRLDRNILKRGGPIAAGEARKNDGVETST